MVAQWKRRERNKCDIERLTGRGIVSSGQLFKLEEAAADEKPLLNLFRISFGFIPAKYPNTLTYHAEFHLPNTFGRPTFVSKYTDARDQLLQL